MSVAKAQDELDFVVDFGRPSRKLIQSVQLWEGLVINELKRHPKFDDGTPPKLNDEIITSIETQRAVYESEREALHSALVRFRELSNRYKLLPSEEWLSLVPEGRFPAFSPEYKDCTFTPVMANRVLKETVALRGAAIQHLLEEKEKAARPWHIKRADNLKSIWHWFDSKWAV
jgi:hypothetical protein